MAPEVVFKILISNFSSIPRRIVNGQVVATVLPHPTQAVPGTVTIADVLGFANVHETSKKSMESSSAPKMSTLPTAALSLETPPSVDDLALTHLSPERQSLVRAVLSK